MGNEHLESVLNKSVIGRLSDPVDVDENDINVRGDTVPQVTDYMSLHEYVSKSKAQVGETSSTPYYNFMLTYVEEIGFEPKEIIPIFGILLLSNF